MAIMQDTKYLIHAIFFDSPVDVSPSIYVGTWKELSATVRTTWSKVPHEWKQQANQVLITKTDGTALAAFTFTSLTSQKLPDHF